MEQAEDALRNLAGLHAPRWNDETLLELRFLRKSNAEGAALLGGTAVAATQIFLDRYGEDLSTADITTMRAAAESVESWLLLRPEPFGVLHGDYRLDNLMFDPDSTDVVQSTGRP